MRRPPRGEGRYPTLWCRRDPPQIAAAKAKIAEHPSARGLEVAAMNQVALQGQEEALCDGIAVGAAGVICAGPHAPDSNELTIAARSVEPADSRRLTSASIVRPF